MADDEAGVVDLLQRYTRTMAAEFEVADVLVDFTRDATAVLGIIGMAIVLTDPDGRAVLAAATGRAVSAVEAVQEEDQEGPGVEAARSGHDVVVDLADGATWPRFRAEAKRAGLDSVAALPVQLCGEPLGAMDLYGGGWEAWSDERLDDARLLGHLVGVLLVHEHLLDCRRRAEQLETALSSRVIIEQAKALVAAERQIPIDEAFEVIRGISRNNNLTLNSVAATIVERFGESTN